MKTLAAKNCFFALALTLTLTGCTSLTDLATNVERELGIKISLIARDDDQCVKFQVESFGAEYVSLSKEKREALKDTLKAKYAEIVLEATKITEEQRGLRTILTLSATNQPVTPPAATPQKVFTDKIVSQGKGPRNQLLKGEGLSVITQATERSLRVEIYATESPEVFDSIRTTAELKAMLKQFPRRLWPINAHYEMERLCAPPLSLTDLF